MNTGVTGAPVVPRGIRSSTCGLTSRAGHLAHRHRHGVSVEQIADLVGHSGTNVTEKVYRQELRPVLLDGAVVMDRIFGPNGASHTVGHTGLGNKEGHR